MIVNAAGTLLVKRPFKDAELSALLRARPRAGVAAGAAAFLFTLPSSVPE